MGTAKAWIAYAPATRLSRLGRFSSILLEVAGWLEARGRLVWTAEEVSPAVLLEGYDLEEMYFGLLFGEPVATVAVQRSDEFHWPDVPEGESPLVHKPATVRRLKGRGVASAMLDRAKSKALEESRDYLRLDCAADRPKLWHLHEDYGFSRVGRRVIQRMVGPYEIAFYELPLR